MTRNPVFSWFDATDEVEMTRNPVFSWFGATDEEEMTRNSVFSWFGATDEAEMTRNSVFSWFGATEEVGKVKCIIMCNKNYSTCMQLLFMLDVPSPAMAGEGNFPLLLYSFF